MGWSDLVLLIRLLVRNLDLADRWERHATRSGAWRDYCGIGGEVTRGGKPNATFALITIWGMIFLSYFLEPSLITPARCF
jgi:hypothetical protein